MELRRREFIGLGVGGVAAVSLGGAFWGDLFAGASDRPRRSGPGYGRLGGLDENGLRLPEGFRSRLVTEGGREVPGTGYRWHLASDGAATFPVEAGGWIMVSNSEADEGGASAVRFDSRGRPRDAYRILEGTAQNCSGGGTPWGTWLSCEEVQSGRVWECDPTGRRKARARPAMGTFKHEAAAVDPHGRRIYMTEDLDSGCLYRFTPERWPDLGAGRLELARVGARGKVAWTEVPDPAGRVRHTRFQVPGSARFKRGEGIWFDDGTVYVATTLDSQVHAYETRSERIDVIYDGLALRDPPLVNVDQMTASPAGELFVCEDNHAAEFHLGLIRRGRVSRFLAAAGPQHADSELTGVTFDPSGSRLYVSSQRARGARGAIYEISGPFRRAHTAAVRRA
jgi:secreted PhoX family phosphatase